MIFNSSSSRMRVIYHNWTKCEGKAVVVLLREVEIFNEQIIQIQKQAKLIIIIHFLSSTGVTAMQSCIDSNYYTLHRHSDTLLLKTANTVLFGALHSIS